MGLRNRKLPEPAFTLEFEHHMADGARQWWRRAMRSGDLTEAARARNRLIWVKELISFLEEARSDYLPDALKLTGRRCAVDDDTWPCRFIYFQVRSPDPNKFRYLLRDIRHPDVYSFADLEDLREISDRRWTNVH